MTLFLGWLGMAVMTFMLDRTRSSTGLSLIRSALFSAAILLVLLLLSDLFH
jgi:hypothetical protein